MIRAIARTRSTRSCPCWQESQPVWQIISTGTELHTNGEDLTNSNSSQYLYLKSGLKKSCTVLHMISLGLSVLFHLLNVAYLDHFQSYWSLKLAKWPFMVKPTISLEWGQWRSFFKILVLGSILHVTHNFEHLTQKKWKQNGNFTKNNMH